MIALNVWLSDNEPYQTRIDMFQTNDLANALQSQVLAYMLK